MLEPRRWLELRTMPRLFALLLLATLALAPGRLLAAPDEQADLISERGVLEDASEALTLHDVMPREFKPFQGPLAHGNRKVAIWLKLTVAAQPAERHALVLLVQPASVADVQVHMPDGRGGWRAVHTGSRMPYSQRPRPDLNFAIPFAADETQPTVLYLRVSTPTAMVHASVLTPDAARNFDTQLHIGVGLYMGLALVLMSLSALMWWSTRDHLWLAAATFDFATLVQVSIPLGFFAKYLAPEAVDLVPSVHAASSSTHLVMICLFFSLLMQAMGSPRWVVLGYRSVLLLYPYWLYLVAQGRLVESQGQVNLWVFLITLWGIPALVTLRTPDAVLRWLYRVMIGALVVYLLYWVLPILQLSTSSTLSLYPALPSNLFTMVMMVLLLARRTYLAAITRQQLELEKQDAESRYRLEQRHHAETSGMLGMIMHEMKNPLASIRVASELLSSGRVHGTADQEKRFRNIQDAVDGIDTVLQRCIDVDRLEQGALAEERHDEDVAELLRQWVASHRQSQRLEASIPQTLPAHLDARLMFLLLGNLVDNALKYSPPQSLIGLRLCADSGALELEVRNLAGRAGWPDPQRLFQKYYRSPTAQHGGGTGLGLYWVSKVSEMLGGAVSYRPQGNEVVFTLRMPT